MRRAKTIGELAAQLLEAIDRKRKEPRAEAQGQVVQAVAESGREPLDIQKTGYVPAARSGTRDNGAGEPAIGPQGRADAANIDLGVSGPFGTALHGPIAKDSKEKAPASGG